MIHTIMYVVCYMLIGCFGGIPTSITNYKLSPIHEPDTFTTRSSLNISFICVGKSLYLQGLICGQKLNIQYFHIKSCLSWPDYISGMLRCFMNETQLDLIFENENIHYGMEIWYSKHEEILVDEHELWFNGCLPPSTWLQRAKTKWHFYVNKKRYDERQELSNRLYIYMPEALMV